MSFLNQSFILFMSEQSQQFMPNKQFNKKKKYLFNTIVGHHLYN